MAPRVGTRSGAALETLHIMVTIGISIPKVPQEVPMEKLISEAIIKIKNGSKLRGSSDVLTKPDIKMPVPIIWRHTPPRLQERTSISIGGTIEPMPLTMAFIKAFGVIILRGRYRNIAVISPAKAPRVRPAVGFSPIAWSKLTPLKKPPT